MTPPRTIAALYVDPKGPYVGLPGVEIWDEARDARRDAGPPPAFRDVLLEIARSARPAP